MMAVVGVGFADADAGSAGGGGARTAGGGRRRGPPAAPHRLRPAGGGARQPRRRRWHRLLAEPFEAAPLHPSLQFTAPADPDGVGLNRFRHRTPRPAMVVDTG